MNCALYENHAIRLSSEITEEVVRDYEETIELY